MLRITAKKRGKRGFTLIELMLTITIIGIISVITFAIISSAMNTFRKQQDIVDAMDMKDQICLLMKGHLRKRQAMLLVNENLANSNGHQPDGKTDIHFGTQFDDATKQNVVYSDSYGNYVIDKRLEERHIIYSEGGRIYMIMSNLEGKYYVPEAYPQGQLISSPASTRPEDLPIDSPLAALNGEYGRVPFMSEELYNGFYVDVRFVPIYTATQDQYRDLRVVVTIYDDSLMTPEHQVAKGSETFHLLNIENKQTEIKYLNDTVTQQIVPAVETPEKNGFRFCYYD